MHLLAIYTGIVIATAGGIIIVKAQPVRRILGALLIVAGFLVGSLVTSHHSTVAAGRPSSQGVPLVASDYLIAVKTLSGQAMVLNAEDTPVLFFSPQSSSENLAAVQKALNAIKGTKRPVMLVSTGFNEPAEAGRSTEAFLNREHITMPVAIQEGPPTLYVKDTPTLIAMRNGRWVQYHGISAITAHLHALASIPNQRQAPVNKHGTPVKTGTKKG